MNESARKAYFARFGQMGGGSGQWATIAGAGNFGQEAKAFSPHLSMPFVQGYKPKGAGDKIRIRSTMR